MISSSLMVWMWLYFGPEPCLLVPQVLIKASGWAGCGTATASVRASRTAWPRSSALLSARLWPPCAPSRATALCSRTSPPPPKRPPAAAVASSSTSTPTLRLSPVRRKVSSAGAPSSAASGSCASPTPGRPSPASAAQHAATPP